MSRMAPQIIIGKKKKTEGFYMKCSNNKLKRLASIGFNASHD
jgi:hypothetical protein